jgi:hypothetical protein
MGIQADPDPGQACAAQKVEFKIKIFYKWLLGSTKYLVSYKSIFLQLVITFI